jgi:hypothetical protein
MISIVNRRIAVIAVPAIFFKLLEKVGAKETVLRQGHQILAHMHKFLAVYFTKDVQFLQTRAGRRKLPPYAMVVVMPRTVHGWVDVATGDGCGVVAHFHHGHPTHHITAA